MRRSFFVRSMVLLVGLLFLPLLHAASWSGNTSGTFTDANIAIDGNVTFDGDTIISTEDNSVTVTLSGAYTLAPTGANQQLFLDLYQTRTITFTVDDYDLTFQGDGDYILEIFIRSRDNQGGTVTFDIAGGRSVSFKEGSGGTKVYVVMNSGTGPTLTFDRTGGTDTDNVFVNIGQDSIITYVDQNTLGAGGATDTGTIVFDPTNPGNATGRLVLNIEDTGGMVIASHYMTTDTTVYKTIPGAGIPRFNVVSANDTVNAGLMVVSRNKTFFDLTSDPWLNGAYDGDRYSFILGNNALLTVDDNAYFDYVGTFTNKCPNPEPDISGYDDIQEQSLIKSRNASAFFVDGLTTTSNAAAVPAKIIFGEQAALFFRSGVNSDGVIENDIAGTYTPNETFTVNLENQTSGTGNIVFDVEGRLVIDRDPSSLDYTSAKLEVLSLAVAPTGGRLLSSGYSSSNLIFPLRTFAKTGSEYIGYNSAAFLVNNKVDLNATSLVHTDVNHDVYEKNDITSEPTYIGGEKFSLLDDPTKKGTISFDNAALFVHENIAFTGLDLLVTNSECGEDNESRFIFFQNGYKVDDGTGRQMILGTCIGSSSCDGCSTICKDTQLDVMQESTCAPDVPLELRLTTSLNDCTIKEEICNGPCTTPNLDKQLSVHTIYLGHASNISIGKQQTITGNPLADFVIDGSFFSFETRGGDDGSPENSNITGQGGIFVDSLGRLRITPGNRANFSTMVTKSGTGIVTLPKSQVYFDNRVGIAQWWNSIPAGWAMIGPDACLSDYTLNWMALEKDYCNFVPYIPSPFDACPGTCPRITTTNTLYIPTVLGSVEQFQVKASRLGDPVHLKIDGGIVRELVFLTGSHSAEAPVGVIVLQNGAELGLGTANRNPDSVQTSGLLGVNGITLVANEGDNTVIMNSDLVINNVCHILKGPGLQEDYSQTVTLRFHSDVPRQLLVKSGGTLDLSNFSAGDTIAFMGEATLVFEPGSRLLLSPDTVGGKGVQVLFKDRASFITHGPVGPLHLCDNGCDEVSTMTWTLQATDAKRVKISGVGILDFADNSLGEIDDEAHVGIESYDADGFRETDVVLSIRDAARFVIAPKDGGVLQTGNTTDIAGGQVIFTTRIDNYGTFLVGARGLLGYGVGVYNDSKKKDGVPNTWQVAPTFNVATTVLDLQSGSFIADQPGDGTSKGSSLVAFGTGSYDLQIPASEPGVRFGFSLLGGSPLMTVNDVTQVAIGNQATLSVGVLESFPLGVTAGTYADSDDVFDELSLKQLCETNCLGVATFSGGGMATTSEVGKKHYMAVIYRLSNGTIVRNLKVETIVKSGKPTGVWTRFDHTNQIGVVSVVTNADGSLAAALEFAGD